MLRLSLTSVTRDRLTSVLGFLLLGVRMSPARIILKASS